jgi:hypothetical protein
LPSTQPDRGARNRSISRIGDPSVDSSRRNLRERKVRNTRPYNGETRKKRKRKTQHEWALHRKNNLRFPERMLYPDTPSKKVISNITDFHGFKM